jgi:polysaccharide export outer membrane protein
MKTTTVLYQLFLERVNSYSALRSTRCGSIASPKGYTFGYRRKTTIWANALSVRLIALSLCLVAAAPAMAQDSTIELQDANSENTSTEQPKFNYNDLPPLENQNFPESSPQPATAPLPPATQEFATEETDYTLGAGDLINLDIFQVEEYSGEYPVLVDGTISLPLVGRVDVRGMSLKETSEAVSKEYATYLKRPIITVGLVAPRPLRVGIAGEVDNPGAYEVALEAENPQFPSVTDMLQQAGGITTIADVRNVRVTRQKGGKEIVYNANLWDLLTKNQIRQDISLRDGDTIFVPTTDEINTKELNRLAQASFGLQTDRPIQVAVVGEVYRPGSHFIQPELLSRDNNNGANEGRQESIPPRLTQAIDVASGIKPLADVKEVEIRRTTWDGEEKVIAVNLWELLQSGDTTQDIILQDGDKVIIPKADALTEAERRELASGSFSPDQITVNVVGEVVNPGAVEVEPNTPLNQAILAAGGFDTARAKSSEVELVSLKPDGTVERRMIEVDFGAEVNEETNPVLGQNDVVVVGRSGVATAGDTIGNVLPFGGILGLFNAIF